MWTSVNDFLPVLCDDGASDDVLVILEDNTMDVAYYDFSAKKWFDRYGFEFEKEGVMVTHWALLPDGPNDRAEAA